MDVKKSLATDGIRNESFNGSLLFEPWAITNKAGKPFRVFPPFWKTCLSTNPGAVLPTPRKLPGPREWPDSLELAALELEPRVDWACGIQSAWKPGRDGAEKRVQAFLAKGLARYHIDRSRMDVEGGSKLSPFPRFGEVSPRQVWHAAHSMRATFITAALANGCSLEDVPRAVDHADPSTAKLHDRRGYNPEKPASFFTNE